MSAIQRLLTDHIDIWTAAETEKKSGRGRASSNAASEYGIKKLRELILELAMRGKLVPQDASDEPASELLKLMNVEKAKLIASGKIKKGKSPSVISSKEIPYKIPNSWEWLRLHDSYYPIPVSGNQLLSSDIKTSGSFPVIDQGQRFVAGYTDDENLLIRIPGPVIVFGDHTTARKYIDFDFVAGADGVKILRPIAINERFFWLQLVSLKLEGRGYARHYKVLNECLFAVPPIWEQTRIVAKVDEMMALCDQLEAQHGDAADAHEQLVSHLLGTLTQSQSAADFNANWQRIAAHFDALFTTEASIDALKQTLLQLAVMGKLVAQDANDEPASELLERVQAEKANLVAEGQVRKERTSGHNVGEEVPFDLCDKWTWCYFEDLWESSFYGPRFGKDDYVLSGGIPTIRTTDMTSDGLIELSSPPEVMVPDEKINLYRIKYGDLLVTRSGSIGTMALYLLDLLAIPSAYLIRIRFSKLFDPRYGLLYLMSPLGQNLLGLHSTSVGVPNVNATKMALFPFPLPPVMEQKRIIEKVNELVSMCDSLKFHISKGNKFQQRLANVLVERALNT